ncbi:MAG: zinc-dependent alcohol dehydrogenase family protein [Candidatus Caldarchaeales archaeon]
MVLTGPERIELREVEEPKPYHDEVVVKVAYCGVCMTDVHIYFGSFPVKFPVILGHECSGIVDGIGDQVTQVNIGDRVAINPIIYCNRCRYCLSGRTNLCENSVVLGGAGEVVINGAYAQYVKIPERNVLKYNEKTSLKHAAFTEPLACAIHGIELVRIDPGDVVIVVGAGPMGLLLTQLSNLCGSSQTIVLDLIDERLEIARRVGASEVVNPSAYNPLEAIKKVTGGKFADVIIDTTGSANVFQDLFKYARKGGRVLLFGVPPKNALASTPLFDIYFRELRVVGSYALSGDSFVKAHSLIQQNRLNLDSIISEIYPLEKLVEAIVKTEKKEGLKKLIQVAKDLPS